MIETTSLSRTALALRVALRFPLLIILVAALLFGPAGTFRFPEAWLYLATVLVCVLPLLLWLLIRRPDLLERRMRMREKEDAQKRLMTATAAYAIAAFSIPGFDQRFGWSSIPWPAVIAANVAVAGGYLLFAAVLRENRWASRVVEVTEAQKVVSSGPYSVVRHPMYVASLIMNLASPIALGSWWGVLASLPMIWVIRQRIANEEEVLVRDLPGYDEYRDQTRYRLLPGVW